VPIRAIGRAVPDAEVYAGSVAVSTRTWPKSALGALSAAHNKMCAMPRYGGLQSFVDRNLTLRFNRVELRY
jgi:hypothetical protein